MKLRKKAILKCKPNQFLSTLSRLVEWAFLQMNTQHFLIIIIARSTYCLRQSVCVHDSRTNCTVLRLFGLPLVLILFNYFQGAATETRAGDKVENLFDPKAWQVNRRRGGFKISSKFLVVINSVNAILMLFFLYIRSRNETLSLKARVLNYA